MTWDLQVLKSDRFKSAYAHWKPDQDPPMKPPRIEFDKGLFMKHWRTFVDVDWSEAHEGGALFDLMYSEGSHASWHPVGDAIFKQACNAAHQVAQETWKAADYARVLFANVPLADRNLRIIERRAIMLRPILQYNISGNDGYLRSCVGRELDGTTSSLYGPSSPLVFLPTTSATCASSCTSCSFPCRSHEMSSSSSDRSRRSS